MRRSSLVSTLVTITLIAVSMPHAQAADLIAGEAVRGLAASEGLAPSVQVAGRNSAARTLARRSPQLSA